MFSVAEFEKNRKGRLGTILYYFEEVESTNAIAEMLAKKKAHEGTIVLANAQSRGRGRKGSDWYSPPDLNLYFSIILRPESSRLPYLPYVTALAVQKILHAAGVNSDLKWPNDVLASGKKISGLLIQTSMEGNILLYAIAGVGLNINITSFPAPITETATSFALETGNTVPRELVLSSFLLEFENLYEKIGDMTWAEFTEQLERHSTYLRGCPVRVHQEGAIWEGITEGLDPYGGLILKTDGKTRVFYAGEIQSCRKG